MGLPVPLVAALAGAIGGGTVAALGFLYRQRVERHQRLRAALYVLLRAWWPLRRAASLDGDTFVETITTLCQEAVAEMSDGAFRLEGPPLNQVTIRTIERDVRRQFLRVDRPSPHEVSDALAAISAFHPALAFEIHLPPLDTFLSNGAGAAQGLPSPVQATAAVALEGFTLDQYVSRAERDLMALASHVDRRTRRAVGRTIAESQTLDWADIKVQLAPFVYQCVAAAQQSGAGPSLDSPAPGHTPTEGD